MALILHSLLQSTGLIFPIKNYWCRRLCIQWPKIRIVLILLSCVIEICHVVPYFISYLELSVSSMSIGLFSDAIIQFDMIVTIGYFLWWQYNGSLKYLTNSVYDPLTDGGKIILKRVSRISLFILFGCMGFYVVLDFKSLIHHIRSHPPSKMPSFWWIAKEFSAMFTYHYMQYVSLISLYLAVIVTTSLSMELMEHNQTLEQHLQQRNVVENSNYKYSLANFLMGSVRDRNNISKKIVRVDEIIRNYAFLRVVSSSISLIFSVISAVHAPNALCRLCFTERVMSSLLVLFGLCIVPAQVSNQFRLAHQILHVNSDVWLPIDDNKSVYPIAKTFMDSVYQSQIGITLGGILLITNRMLLTCLSLVVPYIILCLRLQVGENFFTTFYDQLSNQTEGNATTTVYGIHENVAPLPYDIYQNDTILLNDTK